MTAEFHTFAMDPADAPSILEPGRNCWRIEQADRMTVIIDAADYFAVVRQAILAARHTVYLIGWDFDTRVSLDHRADDGAPKVLGAFLEWVAENRPAVTIRLLKWDVGVLFALGRGSTPLFVLDWLTHRNVKLRLDGAHPRGSAHHQKIVVIDDALAFCGGIDITADRWDTREHLDLDPRRTRPTTRRLYGPWHDVTTAVSGPAAAALGDVARERWHRATGETLDPPPPVPPLWPDRLPVMVRDVPVAVARTVPAHGGQAEVREIERLYLDAIGAARRTLYMESQYFASRVIAEAIAERLAEAGGPEIVVVNPLTADGWLEETVMGGARAILLDRLGKADRDGRFRIYYPVAWKGTAVYVHAKVLIADDRLLRVGSSNLNNRSLGYDTECDLALEAGGAAVRAVIRGLRADLLGEHLAVEPEAVDAAMAAAGGSLIGAIEALRGPDRSLRPFEAPDCGPIQSELADSMTLDPESARPGALSRRLSRFRLPNVRRKGRASDRD
ncbi:phospholipase D-like domain-containing protein [Mongoliimonas terrestris]|uniref:phospholipase D-like domain-containing protein n=1 Tax=Mongoliimonas terrestris TaxID=1709001 RepID=UPI000ADD06B8|nr:phospholipase D-like domain-containing protein [Mongoliimonas terrestris]